MKKVILLLIGICLGVYLNAQETSKRDVIIQKTTPMLHLNGISGYINFYNGDVQLVHGIDELNVIGGRLDVNSNIKVGEDITAATISEINILNGEFFMLNQNGDTIPVRILSSQTIDLEDVPIIPLISTGVVAPTAITPNKIGDIYIDTSAGFIYISIGISVGAWERVN